jgi:hypothetical protein
VPPFSGAESVDPGQISFQTVRPADYPAPYDTMMANNIQFSALDRKASRLSNIMVRARSGRQAKDVGEVGRVLLLLLWETGVTQSSLLSAAPAQGG